MSLKDLRDREIYNFFFITKVYPIQSPSDPQDRGLNTYIIV